jgi:NADH-quinone oxidoreductase subunit J
LGLAGEILVVYTSITDETTGRQVVSDLLRQEFNPREIQSPQLRQRVEKALDYRQRIEEHVRRSDTGILRDHLRDTTAGIADWVAILGMTGDAVASALGMLISRNAIYSALFLVLNFATVAVFFLLLNAPFIAVAQVSVYAGAIMVLFLFVIMLLGAERTGQTQTIRWQRPLAITLAIILLIEAGFILIRFKGSRGSPAVLSPARTRSSPLMRMYYLSLGRKIKGAAGRRSGAGNRGLR